MTDSAQASVTIRDKVAIVTGRLDFLTTPTLLKAGLALFEKEEIQSVDFSAVTHTNSAGAALLLAWVRFALTQGRALHFSNMPSQLNAMLDVYHLQSIITSDG